MPEPELGFLTIIPGSDALFAPTFVNGRALAANTAETFAVPTDAKYVMFAGTADFYATYLNAAEGSLVVNGTFAASTGLTLGTGWSVAAGVASSDASQVANSDLSQVCDLVEGKSYLVTYTVTAYTAGNVRVVVGGTAGTNRSSAATFAEVIVAGSDGTIKLRADLDFNGSVDNLTAVPVATIPIDNQYGSASELNPTVRQISGIEQISVISAATCLLTMSFFK